MAASREELLLAFGEALLRKHYHIAEQLMDILGLYLDQEGEILNAQGQRTGIWYPDWRNAPEKLRRPIPGRHPKRTDVGWITEDEVQG